MKTKRNIEIRKLLSEFNRKLVKGYQIGFAAKNIYNEKEIYFNENQIFGMGSVGKIPIAITLYYLHEQNKIDLTSPLSLKQFSFFDNKNRDAGILKLFPKRQKINLRLATLLMLSLSDNFATNVILETIGHKTVNEFMDKLGFKKTKILVPKINEYLFFKANHDFSESTPKEMILLIRKLLKGKILEKTSVDEILMFMSMEGAPYRLARYLPVPKNVFDEKLEIKMLFSKGGTFPRIGTCSDLIILKTKNNNWIVMVGFTKDFKEKNNPFHRHTAVDYISSIFLAKLGKILYNFLK